MGVQSCRVDDRLREYCISLSLTSRAVARNGLNDPSILGPVAALSPALSFEAVDADDPRPVYELSCLTFRDLCGELEAR